MFHIKEARWRLVPYVILEGHSPDRIQTSIKKRTAAMRPFLRMVGGGFLLAWLSFTFKEIRLPFLYRALHR